MKLKDLPIDMQKKYAGEVDVDGMQRIQFYPADLSYYLQIGTIADMFIADENGTQVLRMTVIPPQPTEYKTVRAPKGAVEMPKPKRQPAPKAGKRQPAKGGKTVGDAVLAKAAAGVKSWWKRNDKPQFMKDAGY